jgi:1-acyl-sn-glycerol-3-phosphate acyltransferase
MPISAGLVLCVGTLLAPVCVLGYQLRCRARSSPYGLFVEFLLGLDRVYCRLWARLTTSGPSPLPASGPAILIANHTSPLDPLVLQSVTRRPIGFFFAREYYDFLGLRGVWRRLGCIPVNRTGHDAAATKAGMRRLSQGEIVGIFPEGRMKLDGPGLLPGRFGAAMLALRAKVPLVPAFVSGAPPGHTMIRPYFVPCRVHIAFGEPIDLRRFYHRHVDRQLLGEVTTVMMAELARLGGVACPVPHNGRMPPVNGTSWRPPATESFQRASA